ncbi:hypothetical protein B6S12_07910 [Helicobacter valdiviensis]|uniref:Glycosyl transferase n=1 Tax=Helicobacter valdiviensis TaxID=1458358 RepID=A0A2W6MWP3_9HELI|nr:capsular polysaccharide synthesis protein [Helicobacter valdiviensis]PZT47648.1 hypothetical protein B6S12_07910 [Helicobacter valdiviensis]
MGKKIIWTFWEPRDRMPAYLKLCMKTWEKFLPEYEIIVLDYLNLYDFLPKKFYDESLYQNFSLAKQADAIRAAILYLHGGVWLDTDTIITSSKIKYFFENTSSFSLFSRHIGAIKAKKDSVVCFEWAKECQKRILIYKNAKQESRNLKEYEVYYYLGNGPLNLSIDKYVDKDGEIKVFDRVKNKVIMEAFWRQCNKQKERPAKEDYVEFYFLGDYSEFFIDNEYGMVMLHNSYTPYSYKELSVEEFLLCKNTLSSIFLKILSLDCSKMYINIREKLQSKKLGFNLLSFQTKYGTAKARIQNQLSYKIGQALIANSKSLLGYIRMPFVLSYIKDKHKQEQKIYQEKIKKDPSAKLPPLEAYPDYKEALKEKECYAYKLGEAFIKAHKTWYKGGYLKFYFKEVLIIKQSSRKK